MRSHEYLHDLSLEMISDLLVNGAWQTPHQNISSASTNDNESKEPDTRLMSLGENTEGVNAFCDLKFDEKTTTVIDIGGGKYDNNRNYMRLHRRIELLVWDPYNRSQEHNKAIQEEVEKNKVDAATSMSVLNVIQAVEARLAHIVTLKSSLKIGGKAYFKIWPGLYPLKGTSLPTITDSSYQANANADRFFREIEIVFGLGNVMIDPNIPNLITAINKLEIPMPAEKLSFIRQLSKVEVLGHINKKLCQKNLIKLLSTNLGFFYKSKAVRLQKCQDQKFGLILTHN